MNYVLWALLPDTYEYQLAGIYLNERAMTQGKLNYTAHFGPKILFLSEHIKTNQELLYETLSSDD